MSVHVLAVRCPVCFSSPNFRCTVPTDTGRREVKRPHHARQYLAAETENDEP